jgi:hypothetical protein
MSYGGGKEEKERTNPGDEDLQDGEIALQEQQRGKNPTERAGRKKKSHQNGLKDWAEMNPGTNRRSGVGRSRRRRIESGKHLTERFS